jgi:hypothetical protein
MSAFECNLREATEKASPPSDEGMKNDDNGRSMLRLVYGKLPKELREIH